jgi:hypothetical protein
MANIGEIQNGRELPYDVLSSLLRVPSIVRAYRSKSVRPNLI